MDGSDDKYITSVAIRQRFGICNNTLRNWADAGKLSTVRLGGETGKRLYKLCDVEKAFSGYRPTTELGKSRKRPKARVCYARVSSQKQRPDLDRQVQALSDAFPGREVVKDVGSGINWKRPGFLALLDRAMRGELEEITISHRDRLCRFAFELLEHVFRNAGCKIVVQDKADGDQTDESELKDDLLAIITVFVASNNGKRAAANRRARRFSAQKEAEEEAGEEEGQGGEGQSGEVPQMEDIPQQGAEGGLPPLV
jgi:predicted site-specific integrase-resolvase